MLDDIEYTDDLRKRQNAALKTRLDSEITGSEVTALARLLGIRSTSTELTPEEKAAIRSTDKYINADLETRRRMLNPPRRGGGSTENQLVRRLFSLAKGAANRGLLPVGVVGQSRLSLSEGDGDDPTLYTRVVLAQSVLTGMDYMVDARGIEITEERRFATLADATRDAEEIDYELLAGTYSGNAIKRITIEGRKGDWVVLLTAIVDSGDLRQRGEFELLREVTNGRN